VHHATIMTTRDQHTPAERVRAAARKVIPPSRRVKPLAGAHGRRFVQARKLVYPLVKRPIVITSKDGIKLELTVDPVDELVANDLLGRNRTLWFPPAPEGCDEVRDPRIVLDMGAHHGFYAVTALARYNRATLIAVEPSNEGVARIERNLALNSLAHRVRIVRGALAAERGTGTLLHTDEGSWGNSLFEEEGVTVLGREQVELLTLADILEGERPEVVKCNAEGAEFELVAQLGATDVRPSLMILMVHPEFGELARVRGNVESLGYHVETAGSEHRPVLQAWRIERAAAGHSPA
jgi:FkbM family methyltransferase